MGPEEEGEKRKGKGKKRSKAEAEAGAKEGFDEAERRMAASKDAQARVKGWQPPSLQGQLKDYQIEG